MRRSGIVAAARKSVRGPRLAFSAWSMRRKLLLVVGVGVVIGGSGAVLVFPSIANASTCGQDVAYNSEAWDGGTGHNGVRVSSPGMYIYNFTPSCRQISSIGSVAPSNDEAEVGWVDVASGVSNCGITGDNTPHLFTVYVNGGAYTCTPHGTLTVNQSDDFSVWGDSSDLWHWAHNGSDIITHTLDFRASMSIANGERHSTYDSAESLFNGMQNGTSPNWNPWTKSECYGGDDPDYTVSLDSATKVSVVRGSGC